MFQAGKWQLKRFSLFELGLLIFGASRCLPDFDGLKHAGVECDDGNCSAAGTAGGGGKAGSSGFAHGGMAGRGAGGDTPESGASSVAGSDAGGGGEGGETPSAVGGAMSHTGGSGGTGGKGGRGGAGGKGGGAGGTTGGTSSAGAGGTSGVVGAEGGMAGEGGCPQRSPAALFNFSTSLAPTSGAWTEWSTYAEPTDTALTIHGSTVAWSGDPGRGGDAGVLAFTIPFSDYGDGSQTQQRKVMALVNSPHEDWTCRSSLHAWVRVPLPAGAADFGYLQGLQINASSTFLANYDSFISQYYDFPTWGDGDWHELVLKLPAQPVSPPPQVGAYQPTQVVQLGVQLIGKTSASTTPVTTVVYIDDITLE